MCVCVCVRVHVCKCSSPLSQASASRQRVNKAAEYRCRAPNRFGAATKHLTVHEDPVRSKGEEAPGIWSF